VPLILGAVSSSVTVDLAQSQVIPAGIVMFSSSVTPALTPIQAGSNSLLWRTVPSDASEGLLAAQRAYARGFRNVAVIHIDNAYGKGFSDAFTVPFLAMSGTTITTVAKYTPNQTDYSAVLTQVYSTTPKPEAVMAVIYPVDGARIITKYLESHTAEGTYWYLSHPADAPDFITGVGPANFTFNYEGLTIATPPGAAYQAYKAGYQTRFNAEFGLPFHSAAFYDAMFLNALAMAAANSTDPAVYKAKIASVSNPPGTQYGPGQIKEALADAAAGKDIDFEGASGNCNLNASGDVVVPYAIWKVMGGARSVTEAAVTPE
jgi:branched-chain amino acid transport system substrate-binding protein